MIKIDPIAIFLAASCGLGVLPVSILYAINGAPGPLGQPPWMWWGVAALAAVLAWAVLEKGRRP